MTQTSNCCDPGTSTSQGSEAACCERLDRLFSPDLFKALGDPNRIALLVRLAACGRPCAVSEMESCCPTDLSVTSRHLAVLRDAGILKAEKRGRNVYYSVRYEAFASALKEMSDAIQSCCRPEPSAAQKGASI